VKSFSLTPQSRLMLIAPHPDDESLAAGVVLQKAVAARAAIRVVYATDGDDNPWPQRALEKKWRLTAADRQRWGRLRRREAIAALETLGVQRCDARFLGLPDQGLTKLLLHDGRRVAARLAHAITDWSPTHLLVPSIADTHPDHSALGLLLRFVKADVQRWSYIVHGKRKLFAQAGCEIRQSMKEQATKARAIACHRTQTKFSRRRFMSYAKRPELLFEADQQFFLRQKSSVRLVWREKDELHLRVGFSFKPLPRDETTLYLVGSDRAGAPVNFSLQLPARSARVQVTDCASGRRIALGLYRGDAFSGEITIPTQGFATDRPIFAKIDRRLLFFDEAGWIEIQPRISSVEIGPARAKVFA
jgi:LmbE family N-acetylglucosaminyl deacetylase